MRKKRFLTFGFNALSVVLAAGMLLVSCDKGNENGNDGETITANGVSFDMVKVAGGTFTMGATAEQGDDVYDFEKPTHQVTLDDFSFSKTEVTQELWEAVMGKNLRQWLIEKFPGASIDEIDSIRSIGNNYPIFYVSWEDIVGTNESAEGYSINGVIYYQNGFCYKLSQLTGDGKQFRLPTEAEWEYAARSGNKITNQTRYSGSDNIDEVAWYWSNIPSQIFGTDGYGPQSVRIKKANALGLYDMSGNVYELCSDWYGLYEYSGNNAQTNPTGPANETNNHVIRGGSWSNRMGGCRVSYRFYTRSISRYDNIGFRLAL